MRISCSPLTIICDILFAILKMTSWNRRLQLEWTTSALECISWLNSYRLEKAINWVHHGFIHSLQVPKKVSWLQPRTLSENELLSSTQTGKRLLSIGEDFCFVGKKVLLMMRGILRVLIYTGTFHCGYQWLLSVCALLVVWIFQWLILHCYITKWQQEVFMSKTLNH